MRKLLTVFLLAICSVSSFALTVEEESTIKKLDARNIFNKERTAEEWQEPIKTIDAASAIIKSDSRIDKKLKNNRKYTYRKTSALFKSNEILENKVNDLESRQIDNTHYINKMKNDQNEQGLINFILGLGVIAAIIL